jgi:hypothetical protein
VRIDLVTEAKLVIQLYDAGACGFADEVQRGCESHTLVKNNLPAGTYFVVVGGHPILDGTLFEGDFTLTLTVDDPVCTGDRFDPGDESFQGATYVSSSSFSEARLTLCDDDVDYFVLEHIGGSLEVNTRPLGGETGKVAFEVRPATVDVEATLDSRTLFPVVTAEGEPIDLEAAAVDLAAGHYLVRVTGSGATLDNPIEYELSVTHACEGDFEGADSPFVELDDASLGLTSTPYTDDVSPAFRSGFNICGGNTDAFAFAALAPGSVALRFDGGDGLDIAVTFLADGADEETPVVVETATRGDVVTLTVPELWLGGRYLVRIRQKAPTTTTVSYELNLDFTYRPPANDLCAGALDLPVSPLQRTTVHGTNVGAGSEMDGHCNGDEVQPDRKGTDVFYALTVAEQTNLQLELEATDDRFGGTVTVYAAPDGCPHDLADLVVVGVNGVAAGAAVGEACDGPRVDLAFSDGLDTSRVRITDLAAGEYLVVVDGLSDAIGVDLDGPGSGERFPGTFALTATLFPEGFPPPEACQEAAAIRLPPAGAATQIAVAHADLSERNELDGPCGGAGQEQVFHFTAAAAGTVTATTAPTFLDTLYVLRGDACATAVAVDGACNEEVLDDGPTGTAVTFDVVAGETYFIVVDSFTYRSRTRGESRVLTIAVD